MSEKKYYIARLEEMVKNKPQGNSDKDYYIVKLNEILKNAPLGRVELAHLLEISYPTLLRILDPDHPMKLRPSTMRKIKDFVNQYEEQYGTSN